MDVQAAATQIDSIWMHLARTERFRGYRPATVGGTALLGLAAALVQAWYVPDPVNNVDSYLLVWLGVATASVLLVAAELAIGYWRTDSELARGLTRQAVRQFVPCLIAGAVLTWMIADYHPESIVLLPGLWALCFSLGIFASLPYVSPAVCWVSAYYLLAGGMALYLGSGPCGLHPWLMAGTFGIGQLFMAGMLLIGEEPRDAKT